VGDGALSEQITTHPLNAAVANRNFRLLWIGGSISVLGSQFSLIALPWLVLQLSDPQTLGLALALAGLSRAIFMLIGGAVTDRISPRKILLVCDWLNFALSGLIAALVVTQSIQIWMIYVFSLATGLLSGFVIPAANSMTPRILPEKDLQAGNSLNMGTQQLMGFVGPALAGVIIGSYAQSITGVALAFGFDAITFAFSAVMLSFIRGIDRLPAAQGEQSANQGIWTSIVTAARYVVGQQQLRLLFGVILLVNFLFTGPLLVGIPILADERLAEGAAAFGLLMAGYAGGNLVGYILAGVLPRVTGSTFRLVTVALVASLGIVLAAFGWIKSTWLDFALMLGLGVENGYISLVIFTRIQQSTPREMLGRVMSMMMLCSMGLVPLSQAISGAVGAWNLTALFALAGGLLVVVAIWLAVNPSLKTLSDEMIGTAPVD
jgi:MFS family permease